MTFKKYQTANNASGFLEASISPTGNTLIIQTAYADLFPDHNGTTDKDYQLTLEHFIDNKVTKREIVLVKNKVGNVFTVEKSNGYCPASWDATTQTNTAFGFSAGDLVELRTTAENDKDIKAEIDEKLSISEYQAGTYIYATSSTGNDDYSITLPYGPSAYTIGQIFRFQADTTNVGTATLNVNGLGAKAINKQHDRVLEGGDIESGQIVTVCYDGTHMQMDSQVATIPTVDINGQTDKGVGDPDDEFITYDAVTLGNKKIKSKNIALSAFVLKSDYPLGEPVTDITKSCVFKETAPTFAQATVAQNVGDVAGNKRVSFPAIGTGVAGNSLKLSLAKVLSPTAFCRVRLETDNAGSPSGTLVDPNATKDIDPATLTTSLADTTVTFPGSFTVTNGQKVHTVVSAVGDVVNASNYYKIGYGTNDTTTRALRKRNTTRGIATSTIFPYISSTLFHNSVLSLTDSDFAYKVDLYGIATALGATGSYPKLYIDGIVPNFTVSDGLGYCLGATPGSISDTPGINVVQIGKGNGTKLDILGPSEIIYPNETSIKLGTNSFAINTGDSTTRQLGFSSTIQVSGYYRIKFNLTSPQTYTAEGKIYKNTIAYGTLRQTASTTAVTFTEDLWFQKGDIIGFYARNTSAGRMTTIATPQLLGGPFINSNVFA